MSMVFVLCMSLAQPEMPDSCLERTARLLEACRADVPAMAAPADAAAKAMAQGGRLFASGQPSLVSEISGRAGGFMMIRALGDQTPGPDDVVLHTLEAGAELPDALKDTQARVVVFGDKVAGQDWPAFPSHAAEFGVSPTMAVAAPAWLFTGELIAALTRLGKMPVIYESIGGYGGNARMVQYKNGEVAFHDEHDVKPVAAGVIANTYVDLMTAKLRRIEKEERGKLDQAGQWVRGARKANATLYMYSMGHLFPDEVGKTDIGKVFRSAVWNAGFRQPHPEDAYKPGDLAVHIAYQHPSDILLRKARPAGARVVYVSVMPDRDYTREDGSIWIDPMWDWPDACVPLEGYDVPLLASSGILNGAIAWEIYRLGME